MNSGVAKAIREKFPHAYHEYINHGKLILGDVIFAKVPNQSLIIANGITQEYYGRDGRRYCSYDAINTVMEKVHDYAVQNHLPSVAMPLLGAGLGGGSWKIISSIIEHNFTKVQPMVYTLDGVVPQ